MKKKIKIGFVVLVFIVVSVCGVSVYRHFTAPKKESVLLETVIQNSFGSDNAENGDFRCVRVYERKDSIAHKERFSGTVQNNRNCRICVSEAEVEETKDKVTDHDSALHSR